MAQRPEDTPDRKQESHFAHSIPDKELRGTVFEPLPDNFLPRIITRPEESPHPYLPGPNRNETGLKTNRSPLQEDQFRERWERIDPDGTFLNRVVASSSKRKTVSERSRERHTTKPRFQDLQYFPQRDAVGQVGKRDVWSYSARGEKEDRVTRAILEAQARRAVKKKGVEQEGELSQARSGLLSTLRERSRRLSLPFRRR